MVFLWLPALPFETRAQTNLTTNYVVPARIAPDIFRVGVIQQSRLSESSGLAASPRHPGVYWTHNDNEEPAFLYAINQRGEHLGAYEVKGARLIDCEAIAFDRAGNLYIADIGTNSLARSHSAIHRLEEPDMSERWGRAEVEQTWYIRYPGEREDAESFFVHDGYGYIITKYEDLQRTEDGFERAVKMYRFSLTNTAESILLEFVTYIPVKGNVSEATLSPDANRLALLTGDGVEVLFINGDPTSAGTARREGTDYPNSNREGAAFAPGGILTTADGNAEILLFTSSQLAGAPQFTTNLTNIASFVGRTVTFFATAIGSPNPTFEWRFNGQLILGATNSFLTLRNVSLTNAGIYEITATNPAGTVRSRAQLSVSEKVADLRITEVMSSPTNPADTEDWWELTSFDPETNDLSGWRFNDSTGGLFDAFVIPEGTLIRPGESIVFVEILTPEEFREWWGTNRFSTNSQIITYTGPELSFRATGDSLRLWDNRATNDAAVAVGTEFGRATPGASFVPNRDTGALDAVSQIGVDGAFQAVTEPDIGSPGIFLTNNTPPLRLEGTLQGSSVQLTFAPAAGELYLLESCDDISARNWTPTGENFQSTNAAAIFIQKQQESSRRFYRLRKN